MCSLRSLGKEIGLALFRGGEQLSVRRASQGRERRVILQAIVGAIVSRDDRALEQTQSEVLLTAENEVRCHYVSDFGVRIG